MNADIRKRLRELSEKATKGPWESVEAIREIDGYDCSEIQIGPPGLLVAIIPAVHDGDFEQVVRNDAEFIAASRDAVPELLDDVDRLEAENASLRARVKELEEAGKQLRAAMTRPIADKVLIEKFKAAEAKWAAALDRANKENQ